MIYLTPLLTTLAYLNGERTPVAATNAPRTDFLQRTLEECYRAHPWRFARATATLTISSGIATLPTNFDISHPVHASYYADSNSEIALEEIDVSDKNSSSDGDRKFWIEHLQDDTYLFKTKETTPAEAIVVYQTTPPTLAASVGTPYPRSLTLALGARRFVKLGQNPDADISQDEASFQKQLQADIAAHQVPAPRLARQTIQDYNGTFTGDF